MLRFFPALLITLIITTPAFSQFYSTQYRVPGQNWMQVKTERFHLVYPERYENEAWRTLAILESEYDDIQHLVGGNIRNFPFILNPENDLSNGFVSPLNFRSEVEISPSIGKSMNPQTGSWLEHVVPHELVHVLHFSGNPRSFTRFLGLFSPDVRRSVHSAAPLGVFEGIAVHYESHGSIPNSGRGNHPYFRNQFHSMIESRHEWSMGQLLHVTDFTPPFDRHYIGGYEFTHWLLREYGDEAMKQSIDFHYRYPFLGFGTALRHTTGYWPKSLYRRFTESRREEETGRLSTLRANTTEMSVKVPFNAACRRLNRPIWLDDSNLLFYARSCNRPTGFYIYNTSDDKIELLYEVSVTQDYHFSLAGENTELIYSRYHADLLYDNLFRGDLHRLDLTTGKSDRITRKKRVFSPEWSANEIFAVQTAGEEMRLVSVDASSGSLLREFSMPENATVVQIKLNPVNPARAAIIGRVKGVQAIWLENISETDELMARHPDIVFTNGSIFDISWHSSGETFLFVSDHTGVMNVYEYEYSSEKVTQITESLYNAFEASYSPDGSVIAYIAQELNEQILFLLDRDQALNREVDRAEWSYSPSAGSLLARPLMNRDIDPGLFDWNPEPYRTGAGWLKPRFWAPVYETDAGFDRIGINLESVDLMSRQSYSADLNHYADRIWYNLTYRNQRFFPGFVTELFNEPTFTSFPVQNNENDNSSEDNNEPERIQVLQQSRGGSFKVPIRLRFESNVRFTSLLLEPQYFISQIRFLDAESTSTPLSSFGTRHTLGFRTVYNFRLRQFIRDMQPNSGLVLFAEARYGLNSDEIQIESNRLSITGNLTQRKGLRAGAITFLSPLSRWNQSLRISGEIFTQTDVPVFNVLSQFSENFSEFPLIGANNVGILNTRYTIPLTYPDDGRLLVPVYLSNIYIVLFSQTVTDLNEPDLLAASRSVFGAGIRSRFRLSNLAFDIGISFGWEPTRNEVTYYFGSF